MVNKGRAGEQLFAQLMQDRYQVQDVSDDPQYYYKGDFILTSSTGEQRIVEVKWDFKINKTKNLYLEFVNKNSDQCIGWWERCSADYLAYGNATLKVFYIFDLNELRKRFETLPKWISFCGDDSAGYTVPISKVEDLIIEKIS